MSKTSVFSDNPAAYLADKLALCGRTQAEVARELGIRANFLTMLKRGVARVPLCRVGQLSRAVGADPGEFLGVVLRAYVPETWKVISETFDVLTLTEIERAMLKAYRGHR